MSEQANTIAAAEVSSEYLSDIRLRVRSSVDKLDGEIKDLILAARADLVRGGVLPARAADETDPLVKQAISTYPRVKAVLGNDNAATKADSITFGTNSTTFTVFRCNSDDWRITEELTTEAAAKAWVKEQLKGTVTPGG